MGPERVKQIGGATLTASKSSMQAVEWSQSRMTSCVALGFCLDIPLSTDQCPSGLPYVRTCQCLDITERIWQFTPLLCGPICFGTSGQFDHSVGELPRSEHHGLEPIVAVLPLSREVQYCQSAVGKRKDEGLVQLACYLWLSV